MKNHEFRAKQVALELVRRMKDPVQALYGFVCQAQKERHFNPMISGNKKAAELYDRLIAKTGLSREVLGGNLYAAQGYLGDLLNANRHRIRALRAELELLVLPRNVSAVMAEARRIHAASA